MGLLGFFNYDTSERRHQALVEDAESRFQLQEYDGEIWLKYNNCLVCPCEMLKDAPVEAVRKMRELYVKRNDE
jgi:hypothetical protein